MNLYLDIDGVLLREGVVVDSDVKDWVSGHALKKVTWSPGIIDALAGLAVDIIWLSSWGQEANDYLCEAIGWEPKEVLGHFRDGPWWKLVDLCAYQDPTEAFVWIDDEVRGQLDGNERYQDMLSSLKGPRMLVSPWPGQGLTLAQIAEVATFVERESVHD